MRLLISLLFSAAVHAAFIFAWPLTEVKMVPITGPSDVLRITIGQRDGEGHTHAELLLEQQSGIVSTALLNSSVSYLLRPCAYED